MRREGAAQTGHGVPQGGEGTGTVPGSGGPEGNVVLPPSSEGDPRRLIRPCRAGTMGQGPRQRAGVCPQPASLHPRLQLSPWHGLGAARAITVQK